MQDEPYRDVTSASPSQSKRQISDDLGALLWRRCYEAHVNLDSHVSPMLAETLKALLEQAGVPEPEDDLVTDRRATQWHGRTMNTVRR